MKTFNAFCGSACVVYRKIMLIHLRKLCMVASSDWGATTYSPQFVYKASLLSKTLHTLWGVKGSHFEVLGGEVSELLRVLSHLLTTYKVFWRLLAAPSRKFTYPTWGKGTSSSNMPNITGDMWISWRVSSLLGLFSWKELVEEELTQRTSLEERSLIVVRKKFPMKCEVGMFSVC